MIDKKRILIFTGGNLGDWSLKEILPGDFLVGVDRGALFLIQGNLRPHLSIGDFDSVTLAETEIIKGQSSEFLSCDPVDKDETDTELAFNWAIRQRPREIVLLGALGSRFDHMLANVHLLAKALAENIPCRIVDDKNEIILINNFAYIRKDHFPQISLLPLTFEVTGITLTGFKYPLHNATLRIGHSLGISNTLLGDEGSIQIDTGQLLVIKSRD